jgi:hypothetical protein
MRFTQRILSTVIAATAIAVSGSAAIAHGYSPTPTAHSYGGSWPVTVTGSQHSNFTGCLTLTASGGASLAITGSQKFPYGTYVVVNDDLVATIQVQGYSQNAGFVFIGRADRRKIGPGLFEDVYGGEDFDSGALAFGMKGGC